MKIFKSGDWGLKILALVLAIVLYHTLKTESNRAFDENDRTFFRKR